MAFLFGRVGVIVLENKHSKYVEEPCLKCACKHIGNEVVLHHDPFCHVLTPSLPCVKNIKSYDVFLKANSFS